MSDCACRPAPVAFRVPPALYEVAPAETAVICPRCLTVGAADTGVAEPADHPAFDRVADVFPTDYGGVALALLLGKLPSLAVEKPAVRTLRDHAEQAGVDVTLTLERLSEIDDVEPGFPLDRKVVQMEQLM